MKAKMQGLSVKAETLSVLLVPFRANGEENVLLALCN